MKTKYYSCAFYLFFTLFLFLNTEAQPEESRVQASKQAWQFGVKAGLGLDNSSFNPHGSSKIGWKIGLVGSKRLVYNMYFQPSISFLNKGYSYNIPQNVKGNINAYLAEGVAGLLIKFGNQSNENGIFIGASPYITIGIGGKSKYENLNPNDTTNNPKIIGVNSFSDDYLQYLDLGFQLNIGYDISRKFQIEGAYYFGLQRMMAYSNSRWRGFQINLTYFFY